MAAPDESRSTSLEMTDGRSSCLPLSMAANPPTFPADDSRASRRDLNSDAVARE